MAKSLRATNINSVFGTCEEFSVNQLPTKADIIKCVLFYQNSSENKNGSLTPFIKKRLSE